MKYTSKGSFKIRYLEFIIILLAIISKNFDLGISLFYRTILNIGLMPLIRLNLNHL